MEHQKILLVDDEEIFAKNMSKLLQGRGYEVAAVNSGSHALEALGKDRYDVVVLDLKMPGMDGIATLKEIKKLQLPTQTIVLTGHAAIDTAMEAMKLGAYNYLTKPCSVEELEEMLRDACKRDGNGSGRKRLGLGSLSNGLKKK
jgi:DNA-binding NtrC family response regulator